MGTRLIQCMNPDCRKTIPPFKEECYRRYCDKRCYNRAKYLARKLKMKAEKIPPPKITISERIFGNSRYSNLKIARLSPDKFGRRVNLILKEIYRGTK